MPRSVADPLNDRGLPDEFAAGAGFVIAAVVSLAVIGLAARVLLAPLGALGAGTPLGWVNGVLGLLPGAVRGLAIAALVVLAVSALPPEFGLREPLAESRLAAPIAETGREALDAGLAWAGIDPQVAWYPLPDPGCRVRLTFPSPASRRSNLKTIEQPSKRCWS